MNKKYFIEFEILFITALLSFCSIVYELLLSNTLAIVAGNYIWWQSMTIGIFVGGLGLGAHYADKLNGNIDSLIKVELMLSFLGLVSVFYVYFFHSIYTYADNVFLLGSNLEVDQYNYYSRILKTLFFIVIQALVLLIGLFSGFEVPLMIEHAKKKFNLVDYDYRIFGFNYLGTLFGTLAFAYYLLPSLDIVKAALFTSFLNLLVCFYFLKEVNIPNKIRYGSIVSILLVVIVFSWMNEKQTTQRYLKFFYYAPRIIAEDDISISNIVTKVDDLSDIERKKSLYQYLDIFQYPTMSENGPIESTILTLDTNFQFNTSTEFLYHQGFTHVSILMNKVVPETVLVLGGGDGLLVKELLRYEKIKNIKLIELDESMIELANTKFSSFNKNSLNDSRVKLEINDGFYYLRNTKEKFDAIFIDFPYPNSYDLSRLYSVEFYKYVKNALSSQGFAILDAPFFHKEDYSKPEYQGQVVLSEVFTKNHYLSNSIMMSTFNAAGFQTIRPYIIADESFVFLKNNKIELEWNEILVGDHSLLEPETVQELYKLKHQHFPYEMKQNYINSIFRPTLVKTNGF